MRGLVSMLTLAALGLLAPTCGGGGGGGTGDGKATVYSIPGSVDVAVSQSFTVALYIHTTDAPRVGSECTTFGTVISSCSPHPSGPS